MVSSYTRNLGFFPATDKETRAVSTIRPPASSRCNTGNDIDHRSQEQTSAVVEFYDYIFFHSNFRQPLVSIKLSIAFPLIEILLREIIVRLFDSSRQDPKPDTCNWQCSWDTEPAATNRCINRERQGGGTGNALLSRVAILFYLIACRELIRLRTAVNNKLINWCFKTSRSQEGFQPVKYCDLWNTISLLLSIVNVALLSLKNAYQYRLNLLPRVCK